MLREVKAVGPVMFESVMPVWPKMLSPRRYFPSWMGKNPPRAQRHSVPTPRPFPRVGAFIARSGRKCTPVFAVSTIGPAVTSPMTSTIAEACESPPKFVVVPVGAKRLPPTPSACLRFSLRRATARTSTRMSPAPGPLGVKAVVPAVPWLVMPAWS